MKNDTVFTLIRPSLPYIFRFTSHHNHLTKTLIPLSHFSFSRRFFVRFSRAITMDAKEYSATDLKRPREEDDNGSAAAAVMETENGVQTKEPACFSTVIPGWFSEMSPMWPGLVSSPLPLKV